METFGVYPISRSRDLTQAAIRSLNAAGLAVTWDWTQGLERSYDETDEAIAVDDWEAVQKCAALLMWWVPGMKGAYTEFGMGYALGKQIVVVGCNGADRNDNIFLRLPGVVFFDTIAEAVSYLKGYAAFRKPRSS